MTKFDRFFAPSTLSGLVLAGLVLLLALLASDVLLILFASVLVATFLYGGSHWIAARTGMGNGLALALFSVLIFTGFVVLIVVAAPVLAEQAGQLWQQLPSALQALRTRIEAQSWGPPLLRQISFEGLATSSSSGAIAGHATSAVTSTFGAVGSFTIICVIGVFLAADPASYRAGIVALIAPSGRARAGAVLDQLGHTLRGWMVAQFLSMAVIGLMIMVGLWILGVRLAVVLGVIAALLTFIPNIGPILAAAPAVLLGVAESPLRGLYVAALYVVVQIIEGNVATPLIQKRTISLPPAIILATQLLMAKLFGLLGLALATPLTAVAITLTQLLYVQGFLERQPPQDPPAIPPHDDSATPAIPPPSQPQTSR